MNRSVFIPWDYELIDFGSGRKLERFGKLTLDRYSPSADGFLMECPELWKNADARYVRQADTQGEWNGIETFPLRWNVQAGAISFELKTTNFGHLGLFPEQFANWCWLYEACRESNKPLRILNLFGYTGASTLACAAAGADVTHVDAAGNVVKWARQNAERSSLALPPIRWIAEDARKFVKRELKRENYYDGVILDPPSYGHGAKGEVWRIGKHLEPLLRNLNDLTEASASLLLLTCHSPGYEAAPLKKLLTRYFPQLGLRDIDAGSLTLTDQKGRDLPSGYFARYRAT